MKKSILFLVCCIGLMFFASCKKDVQPTISVATGVNYAGANYEVYSGDQITVGFSATGENLTKIEMSVLQNGIECYTDAQNIDNAPSYLYTHSFAIDAIGTVTISGTVTDAKGNTANASFDIICYEKPNAKFVGYYEGDALFSGVVTTPMPGNEQVDFENQPFPTQVEIAAGDDINEVIATITINEQATSVKGIVEGDKVTFEAINATYNLTYVVTIPLDMTYNIAGTLNEGKLDLEGDCKGSGEVNIPFVISGEVAMEGTIGGSLIKTE